MSKTVQVKESVIELAQELVGKEPAFDVGRPPIEEVQDIVVVDDTDGPTYVEIFLEIHKNGDACEPLTVEYHPHKNDYEGLFTLDEKPANIRILQEGRLDEREKRKYRVFAAVVGRLTYHEP